MIGLLRISLHFLLFGSQERREDADLQLRLDRGGSDNLARLLQDQHDIHQRVPAEPEEVEDFIELPQIQSYGYHWKDISSLSACPLR